MHGRRTLVTLTAVAALVGMVPAGARAGPAGSSDDCIVRITTFGFDPSTVTPGSATTLRTTVRNCTAQGRGLSLMRFGVGPDGCPVLDPVSFPFHIFPGAMIRAAVPWTAPTCTGTQVMTVRLVSSRGRLLDVDTAKLRVVDPAG